MIGAAAWHWLKFRLGLEEPETQTTAAERQMVAHYAAKASRLVEIGVFEGYTTKVIAQAMPPGAKLHAVDPFFSGRLGISWGRMIAEHHLADLAGRKIAFIRRLSADAVRDVDGEFDFIFVDADHSWEGIRQDWAAWSPRCAVGGVMAFHDTRSAPHLWAVEKLGSYAFYNEVISKDASFQEIDSVDTLSVIRRLR